MGRHVDGWPSKAGRQKKGSQRLPGVTHGVRFERCALSLFGAGRTGKTGTEFFNATSFDDTGLCTSIERM